MLFFRPGLTDFGTLLDIRLKWNINDLYDAHEALDIKEDAQILFAPK